MNISGVLVRAFPDGIPSVVNCLNKIHGIEVHGNNTDGRIVITVEKTDTGEVTDIISKIHDIPGVLAASMIYHNFES